jgi:RNA methyltransferase, TrmH family
LEDFVITSRQNPLVKGLRKLHQAKERSRQQLLLLEGTNLLEAAIARAYPLETVCFTDHWRSRHPSLWQSLQLLAARATGAATTVVEVSDAVLAAIATTPSPDGIIATAPRQPPQAPSLPCSLGVAIETLQDPGNLGTVLRTAAAAQVDGLWLSRDSVGYDHPKVLRASAGQWFRLPFAEVEDLGEPLRQAKAQGIQIVATLPRAEQLYWDYDWTRPSIILLGNEGAGLSAPMAALADGAIAIPLAAGVESLNAALSLGIILYEAQRQRGWQGAIATASLN